MTTSEQPAETFIMIHYPADNGFIAKTGYKVSHTLDDVILKLAWYELILSKTPAEKVAHEDLFDFKTLPYNGVSIFSNNLNGNKERWEDILEAPLTELPAIK
jgi:hypothetical protein